MSLVGQQLGRYRLLRLIGTGGMGEVYLAQDPGINRQVAIKVVRVEAVDYARRNTDTIPGMRSVTGARSMGLQDAARMFQREAKAIAMLDHPSILPLYDYGEQSMNGTILTYLVMPYREEGSLANWLQKGGYKLLRIQIVEQMLQQAAAALQYAHDHQVVHQDVKPSNFLIRTSRENPKSPDLLLTDFGIAKLSMFTSRASQSIRGTPTYMAPEQWEGRPVPATDQYALAVMLYELLSGRPPFRGTPMQMMYAHVNMQPQAPSTLNPHLSAIIDAVVLRGLAKKPEERFPSIIAFAFAFRQTLRSVDASIALGISNPDLFLSERSPITLGNSGFNASATLAISEDEARNGANRNITLPGGRQIRVRIPAGVKDKQVIRVLDQSAHTGIGSTVRVYLSLSIMPSTSSVDPLLVGERILKYDDPTSISVDHKVVAHSSPAVPLQDERMSTISKGNVIANSDDAIESKIPQSSPPANDTVSPSTYTSKQVSKDPRRRISKAYLIFIALLVGLLLVSSAAFFYALGASHSTTNATVTATAKTNMFNTATAITRSGATATDIVRATATANARGANPYPPYRGALALNDPMVNNNQGHHWQVFSDGATGNSCKFVHGGYDMVKAPQNGGACFASATNFRNFTYQIEMTFVKAGQSFDAGGIAIRSSRNNYYYFEVFESGRYTFVACTGNDCSHILVNGLSQPIPLFHSGLNRPNIIAIEANGISFNLFVNGVHVGGPVSDTHNISDHGMIGVFGVANDATTEVVYKDAKVWV
ncbi:MAG TPA: protein kinase [Ktedonobacteraceae bacterium]|nr:protein kinase [Ktedonobacteraceae bacterium]